MLGLRNTGLYGLLCTMFTWQEIDHVTDVPIQGYTLYGHVLLHTLTHTGGNSLMFVEANRYSLAEMMA